ncbi:hypothetical protein STVIR_8094 [Streptomyces viridochromogenes Tue57]|uniref:Uncharacterized protein n=1 Tax=Streptomyces viridochromogenes Tue57 TaxID=1160705 RepID=L8P375_STRVR|nr:hypothetical protein STVIR_8094 [Streptomyces viridochromogenes Tue57]
MEGSLRSAHRSGGNRLARTMIERFLDAGHHIG